MRIAVTGREGQLVRCLAERAAAYPWAEIVPLGRPELDLAQPDSIAGAIGGAAPDLVVNAAAYTAVDQAEDEPELAFRINGAAAGEVAAAARAAGAPVIHISTDYVFDGRGEGACREDDPVGPIGVYGRSKLEGEERVRDAHPDHAIVRTAWVYSPHGRNFVKTMMNAARTRDELAVVDDQVGNPSSAADIADGLFALIAAWRSGSDVGKGETYHLAGTGETSWCGFARHVFAECRALGLPAAVVKPIRTADWPTRALRPLNSRLDCAKFERDFGYRMPDWRVSAAGVVRRLADRA